MSKEVLKSLLATDQDIADLLQQNMPYSPSSNSNAADTCKYDPFATETRVKKILENPCVVNVFVPDKYLYKKLSLNDARVKFSNFATNDRFGVQLRDSCNEGEKQ